MVSGDFFYVLPWLIFNTTNVRINVIVMTTKYAKWRTSMINPAKMLKMKEYWNQFAANHPRCVSFLGAVSSEPMEVGTIIEVSITKPDGSVKCTNIKVQPSDLEMIEALKAMK